MDVLLKVLTDLDRVTKKFQWLDSIIHRACAYFNAELEFYFSFSARRESDVRTEQNCHLKSGLLKIYGYHEESLTSLKKLSHLLVKKETDGKVSIKESSIVEQAAK